LNHNFIRLTLTRPLEQALDKGTPRLHVVVFTLNDEFPFRLVSPTTASSSAPSLEELLLLLLVAGLEDDAGLRLGLEKDDWEDSEGLVGEDGSK
jgi:hypothetical protein